ncbi:coiled-coil domain-containing protein 180 isoform X2 [Engraulis encrasicolus]|uniref:coiled-coil domain-containing protein 180 isoform X2 n=1 Tax=Engraulis encrasicolus TaxID=184585 RepID=UPI002FD0286C
MAETRVIPSGEVYRQIFDAQVQLSMFLHGGRSKRAGYDGLPFSCDADGGQEGRPDSLQIRDQTGCSTWSNDTTTRAQIFPCGKAKHKNHLLEEISGLPDVVEAETKGSDIVERLNEKKMNDHTEAVVQMHRDLAVISTHYESRIRQQAENTLCQLAKYDTAVETLMKKTDCVASLESFSIQDLRNLWDSVTLQSANRREWVKKLEVELENNILEQTAVISTLLRKYTQILEKFSYVLPADVHRVMDSEAMMINQAVLCNKRAVAKLILNLMEDDLQKEALQQLRWEDKFKDWKRMKVHAAVNKFKDFISNPDLKCSKDILATLDTLNKLQAQYNKERVMILQSMKTMVPPDCSKSLITTWYSTLSAVNDKIDCLHIDTMKKLKKFYKDIWQICQARVEDFKEEVRTNGLPDEGIQEVVESELLPLIGKRQKEVKEKLEVLDAAFEYLAKQATRVSTVLFKFLQSADHLWEMHTSDLQLREQQLQAQLEELQHVHKQEQAKKGSLLEIMLDKLRQENSEEALKSTLDKIKGFLEELNGGFMTIHKKEIETVEGYFAMVLEELQIYSMEVSKFFSVKEIFCQVSEELQALYPGGQTNASGRLTLKRRKGSVSQIKKYGETLRLGSPNQFSASLPSRVTSPMPVDCPQELYNPYKQDVFTSTKGNTYSAVKFVVPFAKEYQEPDVPEVRQAIYPMGILVDILRNVRLAFFNHLEMWFNSVLTNAVHIISAKKVELEAEHALRLHLHDPRGKRIEKDIYNVRSAELVFHRDHIEKHCRAVVQSLADIRSDFQDLHMQQQQLTVDFRTHITSMEDVFNLATKSDILINLSAALQSKLEKHINVIQASQRQFRQQLEEKLQDLREANVQFMKSITLFSGGGNFTPKETEPYHKRLEKVTKRIESFEETLSLDMENVEFKCLEQAKEIVVKFEEKFQYLAVDLKFLEKIQGILTNTQVQIKSEVSNSNMQNKKLISLLKDLEMMVQACSNLGPEKTVTLDKVLTFTTTLFGDLRTRCIYLDCCLDSSEAVQPFDSPLQGAFAVAARPHFQKEQKETDICLPDGLLVPSSIGVSFIEDVAIGVVKGLLRLSKPKATQDVRTESPERIGTAVVGGPLSATSKRSHTGLDSLRRRSQESITQSIKRFSKPTRFDKRFQVFGSKLEELSTPNFKGLLTNILWKANDNLLQVAEEFYKKKERRLITRPQYLQETFEQCAEEINRRLLLYQRQSQEYYNSCLHELRLQLKECEETLSKIPDGLITNLTEQCLDRLNEYLDVEQTKLALTLSQNELKKRELRKKLSVRLGHPACSVELKQLQRIEEQRQKELSAAISETTVRLKDALRKHGEDFVTALAALTESLLLQMDNLLTIDDVNGEHIEPKENLTTVGPTIEEQNYDVRNGRCMWKGLAYFDLPDGASMEKPHNRKTAVVNTTKTTLVHLKAIQARDTAYQLYQQRYREKLAQVNAEMAAQMEDLRSWKEHWMEQLKILSRFNAE